MSLIEELGQLIHTSCTSQKIIIKREEITETICPSNFAHYQCNFVARHAKTLFKDQKPIDIAKNIVTHLPENNIISKIDFFGPAILNIYLDQTMVNQ